MVGDDCPRRGRLRVRLVGHACEAAMSGRASSPGPIPDKTAFRVLMERLLARKGADPEWPIVLREFFSAEFERQRDLGFSYAGDVFKDRDDHDRTKAAPGSERRLVRDLYHVCHRESSGCLTIGGSSFWLLGYE